MLADDSITRVLGRVAAAHDRLDDDTWRAVLPTETGASFRLFVRRSSSFARAELSPFMSLPDGDVRAAVLRELLHRNRTLVEARFALDDDDTVVLEAVVALNEDALASAVDSLLAAASAHFGPLKTLASGVASR
jgi:hypothetical protein